jgi:Ca2+/H+ antiporter, TMEM165/GDT1 family
MHSLASWTSGFDSKLFASTFALIFVAELPDKTAFATLLLATRNNPIAIFLGVAAAFVVQSLVAVTFGSFIGALPARWVHLAAGLLFLAFAVSMWLRKGEEDKADTAADQNARFSRTVWTSFVVIFLAEWGDLTQLATASLSARYQAPFTIFISATLSLWTVTAIAIWVGRQSQKAIQPAILQKIAAVAFAGVGIYMLISR